MIRDYETSDLQDLLRVWAAASEVAHPFLSREFLAQERHNIPHVYLPHAETSVWDANGRVVGFIALLGNEVGALFVEPSYHRQGVGRALMDFASARRDRLEVDVFKENAIGRAFYAKYGFEPLRETVHGPTGHDVLRLALTTGERRRT